MLKTAPGFIIVEPEKLVTKIGSLFVPVIGDDTEIQTGRVIAVGDPTYGFGEHEKTWYPMDDVHAGDIVTYNRKFSFEYYDPTMEEAELRTFRRLPIDAVLAVESAS